MARRLFGGSEDVLVLLPSLRFGVAVKEDADDEDSAAVHGQRIPVMYEQVESHWQASPGQQPGFERVPPYDRPWPASVEPMRSHKH